MQLSPQQEAYRQALIQGEDYPITVPGLTDVVVHVQDDNTYLRFTDQDGRHHYQLKGFPDKCVGYAEVIFNARIMRHSRSEVLTSEEYIYQEYDYWPFALANPPQGIVLFGYQQAINGLLRRLPEAGGNEQQYGPSLFTFIGTTITLLHFEVQTTAETVNVDENGENPQAQSDGEILITVTHGDAPYEVDIDDSGNWQDTDAQHQYTFTGLSAGEYFIRVRDKAGVPIGAPTRYRIVTVATSEVLVPVT